MLLIQANQRIIAFKLIKVPIQSWRILIWI